MARKQTAGTASASVRTRKTAAAAGRVSTKDVTAATWVLVHRPPGATRDVPVMLRGTEVPQGRTGTPFSIVPGRVTFQATDGARSWSASVDCTEHHPRSAPQPVQLIADIETKARPVTRAGNLEDASRLVVRDGRAPVAQTVVYVHGIGNKARASVLKCQWDRALFETDMGDRTRMAYWVDRDRYPVPVQATCGDSDKVESEDDQAVTANILALSDVTAPQTGKAREDAAIRAEVAALAGGDAGRERALMEIAERMVASTDAQRADAAVMNTPGHTGVRVLPLPKRLRDVLVRLLTRVFLRDVNDFLFDDEKRRRMTDALWDRLKGGGEPFVIIAHSQGSMVAYDLLRRLPADACDVALLVTIGSPLGLTEVKDHFRQYGSLEKPACVHKWVNIADWDDPVALDHTLNGEYGLGVEDHHRRGLNADWPSDPHSGTGYLRSEELRDVVHGLLGNAFAQPVSQSIVSRDVAATIEDLKAGDLQDVLIQLSDPDATGTPRPLEKVADDLIARLRELAAGREFEEPDRMRRFVRAFLTRSEIDSLRTLAGELHVKQVWSNSIKRALIDQSAGTIQARPAHLGYGATGRGIGWAVIDTGVDASHPHFKSLQPNGTLREQWNCLLRAPEEEENAGDPNGHGTHVAAIIAGWTEWPGAGGGSTRFSGMAPEATLYSFRTLDAKGRGNDAAIIKALDKIAEINERASALVIHGVNLSLGSSFDPRIYGCGHTPLCQELRRLWRQGVLVCIAAGNEGFLELNTTQGAFGANMDLSIGDPANLEEAIAVGSVHKRNPHSFGVSYFSSRGPTADGRRKPDLVAPGEKILSALANAATNGGSARSAADALYVEMSGTSMAAPHVSGALAAFLSVRREFIGDPERVKRILLAACTDLGRDPNMQGAGMVNLVKMLLNT